MEKSHDSSVRPITWSQCQQSYGTILDILSTLKINGRNKFRLNRSRCRAAKFELGRRENQPLIIKERNVSSVKLENFGVGQVECTLCELSYKHLTIHIQMEWNMVQTLDATTNAVGGKYYCYKKIYVQAHLQIQVERSCLIIDKKRLWLPSCAFKRPLLIFKYSILVWKCLHSINMLCCSLTVI